MQWWWLVIIAVSVSVAGYFLISYFQNIYPIINEAKKTYLAIYPTIGSVVGVLVKWFTQTSLSTDSILKKPAIFYKGGQESREDYWLKVKRIRGKERPKNCQGRLEIAEENIDDYSIWRTTRKRYSDIGTDDDLLIFEISTTKDNEKNIIFITEDKTPIEKPYTGFEDRDIIVKVDAENTKPCKTYKKKISNIVKEAK